MNEHLLESKIHQFWDWFSKSDHLFKNMDDPQTAVEEMDNHVLEFGLFSWEIGEGQSRPYYLQVSPNGDGARLDISYKLMKAAPNLRDWEFRYCKPPLDWDYRFEINDQSLVPLTVDASEWEFILKVLPDGLVEVVICAKNMETVDVEDQLNAAEMALTKILGEELVINHLGALEVVKEFSIPQEKYCRNLRTLRKYFDKMIAND